LPRTEFNESLANGSLHLAVSTSAATYLDERLSLLRQALDQTNSLAAQGQLPYAELSSAGLKISPVDSNVPKEADALREDVYGLLPHVKITDLLLEINRWTVYSVLRPFEERRTSKRPNSSAHGHSAVSLYSGWLFRRFESFRRYVTLSATNRLPV